ncbi:hypothetical protein MRX96_046132 [Rhipicephalus microplus]
MLSAEDAPVPGGRSGDRSGSRHRGASMGCSGSRSRSRSRTPTTSNNKKPTLSLTDKARGRRESLRGDESNRGSSHASELDEMRRANEQLRKENAQLKQEMRRLAAEMAEIRKLASSPPSAQPSQIPVAIDTSEALHRPSGTKRRAVVNTQDEEAVNLLSELKVSYVNMQATLTKIQEAVAHPKIGLGALSERISKLEEVDARRDPGPTPLQVPAQRNVLAPSTEGAILRAAIAAQPSPKPKHG